VADERRVLIALTDAGLALRDDAASIPAALLRKAGLDVPGVAALRDQLQQLTETLETGAS
jgi:hypothetical protein